MNKLSKEKRNQIILTLMIILAGVIGIYFGLINFQMDYLGSLDRKKSETRGKLEKVTTAIKNLAQKESDLQTQSARLKDLEAEMAYGDVYAWMLNLLRQFQLSHQVEIPQYSQTAEITDMNLLPKFPYQQATIKIGGSAYYHNLGKFIADFENQYPYFRLLNIRMDPLPDQAAGDKEKLTFTMEIVALVKPGGV